MKPILSIIIMFYALQIYAQKTTEKTFTSEGISTLVIDGSSVFKIRMETTKTNTISIQSLAEGEHSEQLVLLTEIKNNQLHVSSVYQPLFVADNDKLSAHKLISIELIFLIPEQLDISISSNIASVFLSGNYNHVTIELMNGSFKANNFQGNLLVNTIHGDVEVETNQAIVEASSKHGNVNQEVLIEGNREIILNSINGNITVTKTE
ncbi:DUF4097 family beta strand repeat-containing protein [Formosa maritima]|uniref:hypothetical protein n=1 Tax=Formosa maritima TaxID=2592046 RepID=UPI001F26AFE5|nr:hypothetical protein [Formosa maritima]